MSHRQLKPGLWVVHMILYLAVDEWIHLSMSAAIPRSALRVRKPRKEKKFRARELRATEPNLRFTVAAFAGNKNATIK